METSDQQKERLDQLQSRIRELEERVARLETDTGLQDEGSYVRIFSKRSQPAADQSTVSSKEVQQESVEFRIGEYGMA